MKIGFLFLGILFCLPACSPRIQQQRTTNVFKLPDGTEVLLGAKPKQKSDTPIKLSSAIPSKSVEKLEQKVLAQKPAETAKPIVKANLSMRMPDMLAMPEDSQLRSAPSSEPSKTGIIARPPAE